MLRVGATLPGATRVVLMTLKLEPILIAVVTNGTPTGIWFQTPNPPRNHPLNPLGLDRRAKIIAEIKVEVVGLKYKANT